MIEQAFRVLRTSESLLKRPTLFSALLLLVLTPPVFGAGETLQLDPAKSKLTFLLGATGHDVEGVLTLQSGTITFDRATGQAGGEIVIDAAKTVTGSDSRDKTMHKDVLVSAKFPQIVFQPEKLEGQLAESGTSKVSLRGKVVLLGISHELVLPTEVEIKGNQVVAKSSFKIPFIAWGLEDPSVLFLKVDKELTVTLQIQGELAAGQ